MYPFTLSDLLNSKLVVVTDIRDGRVVYTPISGVTAYIIREDVKTEIYRASILPEVCEITWYDSEKNPNIYDGSVVSITYSIGDQIHEVMSL